VPNNRPSRAIYFVLGGITVTVGSFLVLLAILTKVVDPHEQRTLSMVLSIVFCVPGVLGVGLALKGMRDLGLLARRR